MSEYAVEGPTWYPGDDEDDEQPTPKLDATMSHQVGPLVNGGPLKDEVFVVLWEDGAVTTATMSWVSETYDMADCDYGEGVKAVYGVNENCELVPITVGESTRINQDTEEPFHYAASPIMAGTRRIGTVNVH